MITTQEVSLSQRNGKYTAGQSSEEEEGVGLGAAEVSHGVTVLT